MPDRLQLPELIELIELIGSGSGELGGLYGFGRFTGSKELEVVRR